jgi:nucleoid-associated protein YgaU
MVEQRPSAVRRLATVALVFALAVGALAWCGPRPVDLPFSSAAVTALIQTQPAALVVDVAGMIGWLCLAWLLLGALLTAAGRVPGALGRTAAAAGARITPRLLRSTVEMACGALAVAGPVLAAPTGYARTLHASSAAAAVPAGDWPAAGDPRAAPDLDWPATDGRNRPDQPVIRHGAPRGGGSSATTRHAITVQRGDTLWSIAAARLGPGASDAEIAETWPSWYAANRARIGPDPDLLLPGERLRPPAH